MTEKKIFSMDEYLIAFFDGNWKSMVFFGLLLRGVANTFPEYSFLGAIVDIIGNAVGAFTGGTGN
jgi:hypothetical protein